MTQIDTLLGSILAVLAIAMWTGGVLAFAIASVLIIRSSGSPRPRLVACACFGVALCLVASLVLLPKAVGLVGV
ncbi:ABC-type multidrug transport system permease subunit [Gordonia hydrophobica]|nr:ABC-type multidrug transport system permease subunit [Gordonia hydrophobica]